MPVVRTGTKGADKFFAAAAAETFNGLANYDIVSYANVTGAITVDLSNPANNSGAAAGDTFAGIEKIILGRGNDSFVGTGAKDTIDGYFGNDTINTLGGDDLVSGHAGNDTINGGAGADSIWGGGGDDVLNGGNDNDLVVGDKGNDIIDGGAGNDILQGGTGNDTITGGGGIDTVRLLGNLADYDITFTTGGVIVTHARGSQADGTDFISNSVESLKFNNVTIARPVSAPTATFGTVTMTDTGASDGVTANAAVTFAGTVSDADGTITKVEVFNGLVSLGLATVTGGTWTLSATLADGVYNNLRVVATDNDSATGTATNGTVFTVDRTAPVVTSPDLSAASDSGASSTDNVTSAQALNLTGTAEAGSIVRLYNAQTNALLATTTATGGTYAFSVSAAAGNHGYYTKAEDVAGNVSAASATLSVVVDTQAPTVSGASAQSSGVSFTATDANGPLSLAGTFAGLGSVGNGSLTTLTFTEQATLKSGMLQVQDLAGNVSDVGAFVIGTAAANTIGAPVSGASTGLFGFGGDDTITGSTAQDWIYGGAGSDRIVVTGGGDVIDGGANTVTGDTIDFSNAAAAVTFNLAGAATQNTGASFGSLTWSGIENVTGGSVDDILTGDGNANALSGAGGNDTLSGGGGNDSLTGGSGNDTISGGLGTDTAVFSGNYSEYDFTFTSGGVVVTHARGSQANGVDLVDYTTESLQFADRTITRPNSAPNLAIGSVSFVDTGASSSDGVTKNGTVTFGGTVSDFDGTVTKVEVFNGSVSLGIATITGNTWTLTASLADGTYSNLRAVATDNDSGTSSVTSAQLITVDRAAPAAPSAPNLSTASDSLPVDNDDITNIQSLDLSGTAEAGAIVRLYDATTGTLMATTVATGGIYAFTVTVASGTYNFTTTAEDLAGNVGASSGALTVIVDTQASSVVGVTTSAGTVSFTAADAHGPLSLIGTFAGLGAVNNGQSTTLTLSAQATAKSGLLQVQDIAGNPSTVIGLGLGTTGADTLTGQSASGANALYGFAGDDVLTGNAAGDVLYGGDGNDRLVVTAGGDTYNGDANTTAGDTLDFSNATSAVTFSLAGAATQATGASFGSLTWFGIENLFGGSAGDTLTGNASANILDGKGGNDALIGGAGIDTFVVSGGTDTISDLGNGGAEILAVSAGATASATLSAAWTAGAGSANSGAATINTAGFSASVASAGGPNGWTLTNASSATAVTLTGSAFADTLIGGSGADTLIGGAGADQLNGGIGGDILTGGDGADAINLGVFNDNVRDYVRYGATSEFGDTVTNFDVDSTQDMVQFTGALYTSLDDGRSNASLRWSTSNNTSLLSVAVTVGQGNNDREALMLYGAAGEGVTSANLSSASAISAAINTEFIITAADGEDAILVVNDTDSTNFSVWHWVQAGGGETSAAEIALIGVFSANGTVQTSSFGFA